MRTLIYLLPFLLAVSAMAQVPPILRTQYTTQDVTTVDARVTSVANTAISASNGNWVGYSSGLGLNTTFSNSITVTSALGNVNFFTRTLRTNGSFAFRFNFGDDMGQTYSWQQNVDTNRWCVQRQNTDTDMPLMVTRGGVKIGSLNATATNSGHWYNVGNVGIGTNAPAKTLSVNGGVQLLNLDPSNASPVAALVVDASGNVTHGAISSGGSATNAINQVNEGNYATKLASNNNVVTMWEPFDPNRTYAWFYGSSLSAGAPGWVSAGAGLYVMPGWSNLVNRGTFINRARSGQGSTFATNDYVTNAPPIMLGNSNIIFGVEIGVWETINTPATLETSWSTLTNFLAQLKTNRNSQVFVLDRMFTVGGASYMHGPTNLAVVWNYRVSRLPYTLCDGVIQWSRFFPNRLNEDFSDELHLVQSAHNRVAREFDWIVRQAPHNAPGDLFVPTTLQVGTNWITYNPETGQPFFTVDYLGAMQGNGSGLSNITATVPSYTVTNLVGGWGATVVSNTGTWTVVNTNRITGIDTNVTGIQAAFNASPGTNSFIVTNSLMANVSIWPTNLVSDRSIHFFFRASTTDYTVTVTNFSTTVRWPLDFATNGASSFTITNGQGAEMDMAVVNGEVVMAVQRLK